MLWKYLAWRSSIARENASRLKVGVLLSSTIFIPISVFSFDVSDILVSALLFDDPSSVCTPSYKHKIFFNLLSKKKGHGISWNKP